MNYQFYALLFVLIGFHGHGQMAFESSKNFNSYRFSNSNLANLTTGHLLDMEEEWTSAQIDSFETVCLNDTTDWDKLSRYLTALERTDVTYNFEKDSLIYPHFDEYEKIEYDADLNIPIIISKFEVSRLNGQKRTAIDSWSSQQPYGSFIQQDFLQQDLFYTSLLADTVRNDNINIYWDNSTFITNKNVTIDSVLVKVDSQYYKLLQGQKFDLMPFVNRQIINAIGIKVYFSDNSLYERVCKIHFDAAPSVTTFGTPIIKSFGDYTREFGNSSHKATMTILYGCEDHRLNKPFIFVAGWGTYHKWNIINALQGWPSTTQELYESWNQAGIIDDLRAVGYDVIIVRFTPPNASIHSNVSKLKEVIAWVNEQKMMAESHEENVILGYSAGSMCVRLALEEMEKEHLEQNKPHPHTKLYVSYDGEHAGAHIPLSTQHATLYLDQYQGTMTAMVLRHILFAPLSRQLLRYFCTQTGTLNNPGQDASGLRWSYLQAFNDANHAKNSHNPAYPAFSRNISISNGMNESNYNSSGVDHYPFPSSFGHVTYAQSNAWRHWRAEFNEPGGNLVFLYERTIQPGQWNVYMSARTASNCLVLDNAPGGLVFITDNPLTHVMQEMKSSIALGNPDTYNPHTQFAFTPTIFTHDIRNFDPTTTGYRMDYSMKDSYLMFQSLDNYEEFLDNGNPSLISDYWGYPHLAYPFSHYWEATPFDAVFSWSGNTEHLFFNQATRNDPSNHNEEWSRVYDPVVAVVKNFIMDEADYYDAYVQNRRYGWNARNNFEYRAEVIVPNKLFSGSEVTQRTDFKKMEVLENAHITFKAAKAIHLMAGTHIHADSYFHALIGPYHCDYFKNAPAVFPDDDENWSENQNVVTFNDEETNRLFNVYPNPSEGWVYIESVRVENDQPFSYLVFDLNGVQLETNVSESDKAMIRLKPGMYIVQIKIEDHVESHKVIVY